MKRELAQEARELQAAVGGKHINCDFRNAGSSPVFIRELSIKQSDQALLCIDNELALANLFTDLDIEVLETMKPASFNEVIETGMEINEDFFDYCLKRAKRRTDLQERLLPGMKERMMKTAEAAMAQKLAVLPNPLGGSAPGSQP